MTDEVTARIDLRIEAVSEAQISSPFDDATQAVIAAVEGDDEIFVDALSCTAGQ